MGPIDEEPTILVTYRDGTTELRPASSPMLIAGFGFKFDLPPQCIFSFSFFRTMEGKDGHFLTALAPGADALLTQIATSHRLEQWPGWSGAVVWRITGGTERGEALRGEWVTCSIESTDARIQRLTRELRTARGEIRRRIEANVAIVPLNNNGPRVMLRGAPVEFVRHHLALADMRLPDNLSDARRVRDDAVAALVDALSVDDPMPPYVMGRDLQEVPRGPSLNVPDALSNEVEEHRATQDKLREAQAYVAELEATAEVWEADRNAERARADAAEIERDEARVDLIDALTIYGWREDNGGFVSVKHLGSRMLMCAVADRITFNDMLADYRSLRDLRSADAEPKPTISLVADNDRMRRRLRSIAADKDRDDKGAAMMIAAMTAWAEERLEAAGWVRHQSGWIISSDRDMCGVLSLEEAVRHQMQREQVAKLPRS